MLKINALFAWSHQAIEESSFNATTLCELYEVDPDHEMPGMNKLKVILISAICECFMSDFLLRMKSDHPELPRLKISKSATNEALKRKSWRFVEMVKFFNDNEIIHELNHDFYKDLNEIRVARNRVHLLGAEGVLKQGRDHAFFSDYNMAKAEKVLESMLFVLNKKYRRESIATKSEIKLPWKPWYKTYWDEANFD